MGFHLENERVPTTTGCPVCGEGMEVGELVRCRGCETSHHRECFAFNQGCATFACGARSFVPVETRGLATGGRSVTLTRGAAPIWVVLASLVFAFGVPFGLAVVAQGPLSLLAWLLGLLAVWGTALAGVRVEHQLDPASGWIRRSTRVLGVEVGRSELPLSGVEDLVLERAPFGNSSVYLRGRDGSRHLLTQHQAHAYDRALAEVEAASEVLERTAELPALPS